MAGHKPAKISAPIPAHKVPVKRPLPIIFAIVAPSRAPKAAPNIFCPCSLVKPNFSAIAGQNKAAKAAAKPNQGLPVSNVANNPASKAPKPNFFR